MRPDFFFCPYFHFRFDFLMIRRALFAFLFLNIGGLLTAQTATDTTIYTVVESMPVPLFKSCRADLHANWNEDSIRRCAEAQLLTILAQNISYPEAARQANIQGVVATTFVVETNGRITNIGVLKDIGGGCGAEAVRVLGAMDEAGLRWKPALINGKPVRMKQVLPLRFRLEEEPPFYLTADGDSIYVITDKGPEFRGGLDSLTKFVVNRLEYPDNWLDSCKTGIIEMAILIHSDGSVSVGSQLDYNNLGLDFQFQAIRLANRTESLWQPATYQQKAVTTTFPLRVMFKSPEAVCRSANDRFDQAMLLADEGATFADKDQNEAAIDKWTQALALQPNNTELLYYRGTALLALNRRDDACRDWNRVKDLNGITWFEQIRRLACGW